jgi:hypothetical protein
MALTIRFNINTNPNNINTNPNISPKLKLNRFQSRFSLDLVTLEKVKH